MYNWFSDNIKKYSDSFNTAILSNDNIDLVDVVSKKYNKVMVFEADNGRFVSIVKNNPEKNILKFNCSLIKQIETHEPFLSIDTFEFQKLDLLFFDQNNSNRYVFIGAKNSIKKHQPLIVSENVNTTGAARLLFDMDYRVIAVHNNYYFLKPNREQHVSN